MQRRVMRATHLAVVKLNILIRIDASMLVGYCIFDSDYSIRLFQQALGTLKPYHRAFGEVMLIRLMALLGSTELCNG